MSTRREFLTTVALPAAVVGCAPALRRGAAAELAPLDAAGHTPEEVARDESAWAGVQRAYTVDRSMVNLNNGGVCPAPFVVQDALRRHMERAHEAPAYVMWRVQDPQKETVRSGLARLFGCDPEEVAITRNASESLETVQLGLTLAPGDEVVTTDQDYPRMLTTWRQRERRDGIALKLVELPVPATDDAEVVRRFEAAITPRTRVIHMCHVINLTGQVLPVRRVVEMARPRGVDVVVDGAHAFGSIAFRRDDLGCDFYGTSLHKFLSAPIGTGMLSVRRERIRDVWPLMPAEPEHDGDIRKFEEIGTHPVGVRLAIAEALGFHAAIGPERKAARLAYLRDRWALAVRDLPGVRLHTDLAPGRSSGVALFEVEGVDPRALADHLWRDHHVLTVAVDHPRFRGVRVSPHVYTTLPEIDRFAEIVAGVARDGLPA